MAANQSVSGLGRVEDRARRGRCLLLAPVALIEPAPRSTQCPRWPQQGQRKPSGQRGRSSAARHCSSVRPPETPRRSDHARAMQPCRDPLMQNILRTYIPTGGVSRISRSPFVVAAQCFAWDPPARRTPPCLDHSHHSQGMAIRTLPPALRRRRRAVLMRRSGERPAPLSSRTSGGRESRRPRLPARCAPQGSTRRSGGPCASRPARGSRSAGARRPASARRRR